MAIADTIMTSVVNEAFNDGKESYESQIISMAMRKFLAKMGRSTELLKALDKCNSCKPLAAQGKVKRKHLCSDCRNAYDWDRQFIVKELIKDPDAF